ncbi:DEKNAAC103920 [Brettanomyces naardenensis]|uniref:chitinase n=1 Tax=Brettanomyces naardenensis TaxID=13370 RepID=A0A448YPI8_BRENA|nr:DEKNAAC103920 [Brettanomyces naardenensis]
MTNPLILLVGGGHAAGKKLASDLLETGLRERFDKINIHKINMADYMIEDKVKDGSRDPSCFRFEEIDNRVKELEEDESIDIIIVYGLYALYDEELVKKGTLSIFIDTDSDVRLGRWIKRDILWPAKKNPSLKREQPERLKELLSVYLKKSRVEMKNYVSRTRENADVILPNIDEESLQIHFADTELATKNPIPFHTDTLGACVAQKEFFSSISDNWLSRYMTKVSDLVQEQAQSPFQSVGLLGQLSQVKGLNPNLRISLSIGGAETTGVFDRITKSHHRMTRFVDNVADFVQFYGFDGVDIDWEYPDSSATDRLTQLMRLLKTKLDSMPANCDNYSLTVALPSYVFMLDNYDLDELSGLVTYFNIMGYDMSGIWSKRAEFQSHLFKDSNTGSDSSVNHTIHYLLNDRKVDPAKLVLGMPAYGRTFNADKLYGEADACAELEGIKQEREECIVPYSKLPPKGYTEVYDDETGACYATNYKDGIIVYDNAESARLKARYVKEYGLAGGVWWDSNGDTFSNNGTRSLLFSFVDEIGGLNSLRLPDCMVNENLYYGRLQNQSASEDDPHRTSGAGRRATMWWMMILELVMLLA